MVTDVVPYNPEAGRKEKKEQKTTTTTMTKRKCFVIDDTFKTEVPVRYGVYIYLSTISKCSILKGTNKNDICSFLLLLLLQIWPFYRMYNSRPFRFILLFFLDLFLLGKPPI